MIVSVEHLPADIFPLAAIARAALTGRPRPEQLPGLLVPSDVTDVERPPERLQPDEREALANVLEERLSTHAPHVAVLDGARALARPGAAAVVTGQQPGFLGGPLYDVYKALHTVRLARALAERWECPVVPLFWNHADDHDIAEVHHVHLLNPNLDVTKVALAGLSSGRKPFSNIVIDAEAQRLPAVAEHLRQLLGEDRASDELLERFLPRGGETLAAAFTRTMTSLLGRFGVVVVEPAWIRPSLSRALAHVVGHDPAAALDEGSQRLRAHGLEPAIDPDGAALVFHHENGERRALRAGGEGFRFDDEPGSRTPAELAAEIVQAPAEWSPGALLRPLVQDLALPVAAYVGGMGELAYHAQLPPLRERAGVHATPFVPRLACTLVEPDVSASLDRIGAAPRDVLATRGTLEVVGDGSGDTAVAAKVRRAGTDATAALRALEQELAALDPGLARQLARTGSQIEGLTERLAGKAERADANRRGGGQRHLRRVNHALCPRGEPQERVRGVFELVARAGESWLDTVLDACEPFPTEHLVHYLPKTALRGEVEEKQA